MLSSLGNAIHYIRSLDVTLQALIIAGLVRAAEAFYTRYLTRGDRLAAEEQAVWDQASSWREEQRTEIVGLRDEVRGLREEVRKLREENEAARDLMCANARECENRVRVS